SLSLSNTQTLILTLKLSQILKLAKRCTAQSLSARPRLLVSCSRSLSTFSLFLVFFFLLFCVVVVFLFHFSFFVTIVSIIHLGWHSPSFDMFFFSFVGVLM
ncbi:hypothetical protein Pfo_021440, partial [Paulownia fortunei]